MSVCQFGALLGFVVGLAHMFPVVHHAVEAQLAEVGIPCSESYVRLYSCLHYLRNSPQPAPSESRTV